MSGQWEVVGRKKDKSGKTIAKPDKKDKKKNNVIEVNMDEIFSKSQVKNLYSSDKNKENKKPQDNKNKSQDNNVKKVQKKPEKPQEAPKVKLPKSIESALISIDVDEFKNIFEKTKHHFPDAPIVWLKELSQYLNQKVPVEVSDPVFTSKPDGYPLSVVPSPLKSMIEKSLKEAGEANVQAFFDITLTSMATDMGKGLPALGHKFYLQCIGNSDPVVGTASMNKHIVLRNSYQNRPNIGLSILWAVGQTGMRDVNTGLKVFEDLMLPLIEMKNYSKYVVSYLLNLLRRHKNAALTKEQYILIIDTIFSNTKNFPHELKQELLGLLPNLKSSLFKGSGKEHYRVYVDTLLKRLAMYSNKPYQDCLCDIIVGCFMKDVTSLDSWNPLYTKHLQASAVLINYIGDNWQLLANKINVKNLTALLNTYKITNEQLLTKKRKDDGLSNAITAIKKVSEKMTKRKKTGFPIKTLLFLISVGITVGLYVDINQHGSWKDCQTNKVLRDSGIHEYTHKALNRTKDGLLWVDEHVEKSFPGVHKTVIDFSEPYITLTKQLGLYGYNVCANLKESLVEKYPSFIQTIDSYAPGVIESSQKAVTGAWKNTKYYVHKSVNYLKNDVFVGKLSPEHMKKVALEAFNVTQQKASEYYHWLYEKVQTTIK